MAIRVINASREAMITDINTRLSAGAGAPKIRVYEGSVNGTKGVLPTGTFLGEFVLSDPAFILDGDGSAAGGAVTDLSPVASGTAACFAAVDSDNNVVFDGTVGTSNADLIVSNVAFATGTPVQMSSMSLTAGNN